MRFTALAGIGRAQPLSARLGGRWGRLTPIGQAINVYSPSIDAVAAASYGLPVEAASEVPLSDPTPTTG